jgi:hypothetical protein
MDYRVIKEAIESAVLAIANYTQEGRAIHSSNCLDTSSLQWGFVHGDKQYVNLEAEDKGFPIALLDPLQWNSPSFVDGDELYKTFTVSMAFLDQRDIGEKSNEVTTRIEKVDEAVNEFLLRLNNNEAFNIEAITGTGVFYFDWNSYITCGKALQFTVRIPSSFDFCLLDNNIEDLKCN